MKSSWEWKWQVYKFLFLVFILCNALLFRLYWICCLGQICRLVHTNDPYFLLLYVRNYAILETNIIKHRINWIMLIILFHDDIVFEASTYYGNNKNLVLNSIRSYLCGNLIWFLYLHMYNLHSTLNWFLNIYLYLRRTEKFIFIK